MTREINPTFKLLILTTHFPPRRGGVETDITEMLNFLEKNGRYKATVITYDNSELFGKYENAWKKITVIRIKIWKKVLLILLGAENVSSVNTLFKKIRFALLHTTLLFKAAVSNSQEIKSSHFILAKGAAIETLVSFIISKIYNKPFVVRWHTDLNSLADNTFFKKVLGICLRSAQKVLVNGHDIKKQMEKFGVLECEVRSQIVNTDIFYPQNFASSENFKILFAAMFNKVKFCDVIIETADLLLKKSSKYYFTFLGDGPYLKNIEILKSKYPNHISVEKAVSRVELSNYMNSSNIVFGFSDVDYAEKITLETISCGIPTLVFDRSIHEVKRDKEINVSFDNEYFVKIPTNPKEIVTYINKNEAKLLDLKKNHNKRINSNKFIENKFGIDKVFNDEISEYIKKVFQ